MPFEIIGTDSEDAGPKGVVIRFMLAAVAGEDDAAIGMLTRESREGAGLNAPAVENAVVFGDVTTDGDHFVVPTTTDGDEMEFLVIEEEGELRLDMNATFARMMGGMSPDDLMDEMGGAIAESMGGVMEGMTDAMGEAFGAVGDAMDAGEEEEAATGRIWSLAEGRLNPDNILDEACALAGHLPGEFTPPTEEGEASESGNESTKFTSTRFGTDTQGLERVRTEYAGSGMTSDSVTVTAYGLTEGLDLSLTWATTTLSTQETMMNIAVRIAAPGPVLDSMGGVIAERFEVVSVNPF